MACCSSHSCARSRPARFLALACTQRRGSSLAPHWLIPPTPPPQVQQEQAATSARSSSAQLASLPLFPNALTTPLPKVPSLNFYYFYGGELQLGQCVQLLVPRRSAWSHAASRQNSGPDPQRCTLFLSKRKAVANSSASFTLLSKQARACRRSGRTTTFTLMHGRLGSRLPAAPLPPPTAAAAAAAATVARAVVGSAKGLGAALATTAAAVAAAVVGGMGPSARSGRRSGRRRRRGRPSS